MSNTAMTSEVPVDNAALDTALPQEPVAETPKQKKGVFRLLAIVLLAACVGLCLLSINTLVSAWVVKEQNLLEALFDKGNTTNEKLFGILPALVGGDGNPAMIANLSFYVLVIGVAVAALLSLIALLCGKRGLVVTAAFLLTWSTVLYFVCLYCLTNCNGEKAVMDVMVLAIAVVALLVSFCLKATKLGKSAWFWLFNVILALGVAVVAFMGLMEGKDFSGSNEKIALILAGVALLLAVVVYCRKKAGLFFAILDLIVAAVIAVFVLAMDVKGDTVFVIVAAALALLLFLVSLPKRKKKEKPVEAEEVPEFKTETFVEAYAYDGGPVAGVQLAEEVFPTVAAIEAVKDPDGTARNTVASLLGNGFDPFLITLSEKEKEEFIDLYVLKCKGTMPEIPGYVVGGNNKEFFNCVFIYLGQYREKIPASLLEKMYKFSMKI